MEWRGIRGVGGGDGRAVLEEEVCDRDKVLVGEGEEAAAYGGGGKCAREDMQTGLAVGIDGFEVLAVLEEQVENRQDVARVARSYGLVPAAKDKVQDRVGL